jgi:branched-chain amino acid transport system ATP-binding protein
MYFRSDNMAVRYDKVLALKGVSIALERPNQIIALIGANGAGKTTTLRAITGLSPLASGEVWFQGERLDKLSTAEIVARGVVMVPEGRRIYPFMTVKDNLMMGAYLRRDTAAIKNDLDRTLARFPRLRDRLRQQGGTLSGGEQEMLAIGRALMSKPKLFLLDEPSLGLAPLIVREIAKLISDISSEEGVGIILVEQNSRMALRISDYAYVLETGSVALHGPSTDLIDNDHVKELYLGGT